MGTPLRILFLSNRGLLPVKDGHTRRSYNVLKGLAGLNQVYYLSLYETPEEIEDKNVKTLEFFCDQVEFFRAPPKTLSIPMLMRLFRSFFSLDPYTIWRHYSRAFLKRADELISFGGFDLVHCDILPLAYAVRTGNRIFRSITDHDVSYLKCRRIGENSRNFLLKGFLALESLKLKRLESKVFTQVDLGIAVSELDKEKLQKLCPAACFVAVENGVEADTFKPDGSEVEPRELLWLGGFDHLPNREGIYYFLKSIYPIIRRELPEIRLNLVGGGVTGKLRTLTQGNPSIRLSGFVEDPIPQIQRACVFIVPILSGGGTRLKLLEAMSMGKAVVTTSLGCEGVPGTDGVHFLVGDTPEEFAGAVLKVVHNPELRLRLGSDAREFIKRHYEWGIIIEKLNRTYLEARRIKGNRSQTT